jgi:hypothetical protein
MNTIADYIIKNNRKIGHWDALLEEWILLIERFSRVTGGDVPYWHNERANIGVLSAAAWRCGRIALEEFQHDKIDVTFDEDADGIPRQSRIGRCDLWICDDRSDRSVAEIVEAKFKWLNMKMNSKEMGVFAKACLKAACDDAIKTKKARKDGIKAIGVAFLPVFAKKDKVGDLEELSKVIDETIKSACKTPADLVAWCFPKRLREHVVKANNNYLPGVIMLAKVAK